MFVFIFSSAFYYSLFNSFAGHMNVVNGWIMFVLNIFRISCRASSRDELSSTFGTGSGELSIVNQNQEVESYAEYFEKLRIYY